MSNATNNSAKGTAFGVRYIAVTGILSAIAYVLMLIEIPLPMIIPSFVKLDFSDLPALVGSFAMGPICGVIVEFIKNILKLPFTGSFGVGELCNFMLGAIFALTAGILYKKNKSRKGALIGCVIGALAMAIVSIPSNYFITYPFYYNFIPEKTVLEMYQVIVPSMKSILQCLICFNAPFTFVKGMLDVLLTFLIYKHISPILKGSR